MQCVFSDQNLNRYRQLASGTLTVEQRKIIFDCLAKQSADFRAHWSASSKACTAR